MGLVFVQMLCFQKAFRAALLADQEVRRGFDWLVVLMLAPIVGDGLN